MIPVPGYGISTPYGKRGSYWSCNRDQYGNGIHTGADFAAPAGSRVVAARGGKAVYCNHGSSFGYHQIEILPGDGTRDFYAHMPSRAVADGSQVAAGDTIGKVGSEGNVTGPHLHFERHTVASGGWSCAVVTDPQPSIDYQPAAGGGSGGGIAGEEMPDHVRGSLTKALDMKAATWATLAWDTIHDGEDYLAQGSAQLRVGGQSLVVTLTATVDPDSSDAIRTRWLEREHDGSDWQTAKTWPTVEHLITAGTTGLTDTRTLLVGSDRRLICQAWMPDGGKLSAADLNALVW